MMNQQIYKGLIRVYEREHDKRNQWLVGRIRKGSWNWYWVILR